MTPLLAYETGDEKRRHFFIPTPQIRNFQQH
jgi:hypothetical protein